MERPFLYHPGIPVGISMDIPCADFLPAQSVLLRRKWPFLSIENLCKICACGHGELTLHRVFDPTREQYHKPMGNQDGMSFCLVAEILLATSPMKSRLRGQNNHLGCNKWVQNSSSNYRIYPGRGLQVHLHVCYRFYPAARYVIPL